MSDTTTALRLALADAHVGTRRMAQQTGLGRTTVLRCLNGGRSGERTKRLVLEAAAAFGVQLDDPWAAVPVPDGGVPTPRSNLPPNPAGDAGDQELDMIPTREFMAPAEMQALGLHRDPFDDLDPHEEVFRSPTFKFVRRAMIRAVERGTIVAVAAEVGSGKTTLLRDFQAEVDRKVGSVRWLVPGNLDRGQINEGSLASAILRDLDVEEAAGRSSESRGALLRTQLERLRGEGEYPALVIDEAHDLSTTGLIAIKRLWDSFTLNRSIGVILVGQKTLATKLRRDPAVRELAGRTHLLDLPGMRVEDVHDYLDYRLRLAGSEYRRVFSEDAAMGFLDRQAVTPLFVNAIAVRAIAHAQRVGLDLVNRQVVARC